MFEERFLPESREQDNYYYKDDDGVLRHRSPHWTKEVYGFLPKGLGDSLWRTSLASMVYKDKDFISAAETLFEFRRRYFGRQPSDKYHHPTEDFTRDQLIMALCMLKFFNQPIPKIPWRISKNYTLTIDLWLWIQYLRGFKSARTAYLVASSAVWSITNLWDSIIYGIIKIKGVKPKPLADPNNYKTHYIKDMPKSFLRLRRMLCPMFARHLASWMNYIITPNRFLGRRILKHVPKANYVLYLLNGFKPDNMSTVKHRTGYMWQSRLEAPSIEENDIIEEERYSLDIDVLSFLSN